MEHAIGEGLVLDIIKDVLLQTLPDDHPGVSEVKKKLRSICREEKEHVAWLPPCWLPSVSRPQAMRC